MSAYRRAFFLITWVLLVLAWSAPAGAYQERLILAMTEGGCSLRVEADDQSQILRLRLLPEAPGCHFSKNTMQTILKAAFAKTDPPKLEGVYASLFLGRLVEYPWISEYLAVSACKDPGWNGRKGRPVSKDLNAYVRDMLVKAEVTAPFDEAFGDSGYKVVGMTVEKVGVSRFEDVSLSAGTRCSGKVPYDALVWLHLGTR